MRTLQPVICILVALFAVLGGLLYLSWDVRQSRPQYYLFFTLLLNLMLLSVLFALGVFQIRGDNRFDVAISSLARCCLIIISFSKHLRVLTIIYNGLLNSTALWWSYLCAIVITSLLKSFYFISLSFPESIDTYNPIYSTTLIDIVLLVSIHSYLYKQAKHRSETDGAILCYLTLAIAACICLLPNDSHDDEQLKFFWGFFSLTFVFLQLPLGRYISKLLHYSIPANDLSPEENYTRPTSISAPKPTPPLVSIVTSELLTVERVPSFSNATKQRSSQEADLNGKAPNEPEFDEKHHLKEAEKGLQTTEAHDALPPHSTQFLGGLEPGQSSMMHSNYISETVEEAAKSATAYMGREATDLSSGHTLDAAIHDPPTHPDEDSTYGDNSGDSDQSQTPTPSIMQGQEQNGRWYATYGKHFYHFPIDARERMREASMEHLLYTFTMTGRLLLAPVEKAGNDVLDIGTGSGVWAVDFGDKYPTSLVLGRDINLREVWSANNCMFEIDDCEMPWRPRDMYDIIHIRSMTAGIRDWSHLFDQCFDHLRLGGCIEVQDFDFRVRCDDKDKALDSHLCQWGHLMITAAQRLAVDLSAIEHCKDRMQKAGFVDVQEETFKWPIGDWPQNEMEKSLGRLVLANLSNALEGYSLAFFTQGLGWSRKQVDDFLTLVRKDLDGQQTHAYLVMKVCYARKLGKHTSQP